MSEALEPRVVFVGMGWFGAHPGGLNRYLADLLGALQAAGVPVRAVVLGPAAGAPAGVTAASSEHAPLARRLLALRRAAVRVGSKATVVDSHFALHAFLPLLTSRLGRLPLVVHFQGPWADESVVSRGVLWVTPLKRAVERMVYRRAARVIVLSGAFGRLLADRYGVDPARIVVIPPGVDLERFTPGDRAAARSRFQLAADTFLVVSARRLDARMGLDSLLSAWRQVQTVRPEAVLLVAGDGPERSRLDELRRRLPDPGSVRLLGHVSDDALVALYRAADCSVVPSRALEGFGLVVLESMACGTPCIVTDSGGLPEALKGFPSLVVPAGDPHALAGRLLDGAARKLPTPDQCRAHAERFVWSDVARRHVELYRDVSGLAPRRLRVVFVDHCAQLSGGELALLRLLPALRGVDSHVVLAEDGPFASKLIEAGISVEVLPMAEKVRGLRREQVQPGRMPPLAAVYAVTYVARLAKRLRRLRPDLVHTNSLKAAIYGGIAGRLVGVPVVWHFRDRIADDYLPPVTARLVRALARWLPMGVIANSQATLVTLEAAMPSVLGEVIPSTIVSDPWLGFEMARAANGELFRVGIVGRLAPWKGQHLFLDAFARAFPQGHQAAVIVGAPLFGEEAYEAEIREQIVRLGLDGRVELRGFRYDVAAELARLDVLVHASIIPEPFGQVVVEGMAAGLAVVAPAAGGPAETITDDLDGLLYPMGDAGALAGQLRRLAADPALRSRVGNAARRRAAEFTPERAATGLIEFYRRVLGDRWPENWGSPAPRTEPLPPPLRRRRPRPPFH